MLTSRVGVHATLDGNCIVDTVIATSDESFAATGEKDRECVTDGQLNLNRLQIENAAGERAWMIKVSDTIGDDLCLQPVKVPECKRSSFLLTPETFELEHGQTVRTPAFEIKIFGDRWVALQSSKQARVKSDLQLLMLVDGGNLLTIVHGGKEQGSLEQIFEAYRIPISKVAPAFKTTTVARKRFRTETGELMKSRSACGELPNGVRVCVLAAAHAKTGLTITSTYREGETNLSQILRSLRLL
jgi:hypothetical protein